MDIDDRLDALARPDKWFLSGGDGVLWAPPHPLWLHRPGFWDEALVDQHPFAPLFSVALVDERGRDLALQETTRRWWPDRLEVTWRGTAGPALRETRTVMPGGWFVSAWDLADEVEPAPANPTEAGSDESVVADASLVAFSVQPGPDVPDISRVGATALEWPRALTDRRGQSIVVSVRFEAMPRGQAGSDVTVRRAALRSEGALALPEWNKTPFVEAWDADGLREHVSLQGISTTGLAHAAIAVSRQHLESGGIAFAMRVTVPADRHGPPAIDGFRRSDSRQPWQEFFARFPAFTCADPFLARYYDYRIYGLRLNRLAGGLAHRPFDAIAEGIGDFHVPITYSAQCHMFEMRWARDPAEAHGSLRNFLAHQKADGSFHGRIYRQLERTDFYHANWGDAVLAVDALHPDRDFLAEAYTGLQRYARWLDATRDRESSGMYDVVDQYETGQEYMSRYVAVDPEADRYGWENRIRLKGIDVTVYTYQLKRALARLAEALGDLPASRAWHDAADRIGAAILDRMWDPGTRLFSDVDPRSMARTGVKAAVCFYPLLTDLLDDDRVAALLGHLGDPREFGTRFPLPSSSVDDPLFDAEARWRGKRHVCPWNGRLWPMTTSHVVEGLIRQWHRGRIEAGRVAGEMLGRFVRVMFHDGDLARPNCFEHYNPHTGHACVYRGIDDYMHSWVVDLIIRGVLGLEPRAHCLLLHPLPMSLDEATLAGELRGQPFRATRGHGRVTLRLGDRSHETTIGTPLEVPW